MLTEFLLQFALIGAEWVLWVLVILSLVNGLIMVERIVFFAQRSIDIHGVRVRMEKALQDRDFKAVAEILKDDESMEARVVLYGLREYERGEEAVEELMAGALATERIRYDRGLGFLGTIGNNAPFIGLFGTVLGIIAAFDGLADGSQEGAQLVMGAISEALVATGVGLLVAIPAVIAFNFFKARVKKSVAQTQLLGGTLRAYMHEQNSENMGNV